MPPKKQAADPQPSSKPASAGEPDKKKTSARAAAVRKPASHPSTAAMVREALEALDSRKGVSSQALQRYIKQTYPTVEPVRLKHLVRRVLKNGLLSGTLLAPKVKEVKPKSENTDPNGQKPKAGAKKTQTEDATKKKPTKEKAKSTKKPKAPKTTKDEADVPPVKKPKAKKAEAKGSGAESSEPTKNKTAKAKGAKTDKKTQNKAATSGSDAPASKTAGKRVKKTV
ncbi:protein B4 isoform X2 [Poeciliopsis prolifica]|uniref:protein B4 isoform X2 n=1 Tax=Poeciliopsis prolifica TaxID=188132 RepID=UPI002412F4C9|nr:protein B4 isoform X2 [Poeciliopsis prolifica]